MFNQAEAYSCKKIEELEAAAKIYKVKGLAWIKVTESGAKLEGNISKFFEEKETEICSKLGAEKGDLILL